MTITVDYSREDLKAYAYHYYASDEAKQQWKGWQAALTVMSVFLYFILFKSLPTVTALLWIAGATLLTYVLIGWYHPVYVRRSVAEYVRVNAPGSLYTVTLALEGIRYTEKGDTITYGWSTLRKVEERSDGYLELNLLDSAWHIPPSSFTDSQHRTAFLQALEEGRKGETNSTWWTQGNS